MAKRRPALGRGLDALIPSDGPFALPEAPGQVAVGIVEVRTDCIATNPYQPRQDFDDDALRALALSIEQLGIIQPITVKALGDGRYETIAGERRLRAARQAGLRRVPVFVREANKEEMLEMALVENVQREQLNPIEVALAYQRLVEECGLNQEQVATKVGKTRSSVTNALRLLRLPPRVQAAVRERALSMGHARALLSLTDTDAQLRLFELILRKKLSVRQVEQRVRQLTQQVTKKKRRAVLPARVSRQLEAYEQSLRTHYGTRVKLTCDAAGKGTIEFHYFSTDDLERMLELLLGQQG